MPDRITVSLSAVKVQNFAGSPRATMTGEAEFSDGERLRFRYRPAHDTKAESIVLFTMRHGTGVTSTHRERVTMAAAREVFNARRAEETPLWAFVQRVAALSNSNSEPDTMGEALDGITGAAADLLAGRPGPLPFVVVLHCDGEATADHWQVYAADPADAVRKAWEKAERDGVDLDPTLYDVLAVFPGEIGDAVRERFSTVAAVVGAASE